MTSKVGQVFTTSAIRSPCLIGVRHSSLKSFETWRDQRPSSPFSDPSKPRSHISASLCKVKLDAESERQQFIPAVPIFGAKEKEVSHARSNVTSPRSSTSDVSKRKKAPESVSSPEKAGLDSRDGAEAEKVGPSVKCHLKAGAVDTGLPTRKEGTHSHDQRRSLSVGGGILVPRPVRLSPKQSSIPSCRDIRTVQNSVSPKPHKIVLNHECTATAANFQSQQHVAHPDLTNEPCTNNSKNFLSGSIKDSTNNNHLKQPDDTLRQPEGRKYNHESTSVVTSQGKQPPIVALTEKTTSTTNFTTATTTKLLRPAPLKRNTTAVKAGLTALTPSPEIGSGGGHDAGAGSVILGATEGKHFARQTVDAHQQGHRQPQKGLVVPVPCRTSPQPPQAGKEIQRCQEGVQENPRPVRGEAFEVREVRRRSREQRVTLEEERRRLHQKQCVFPRKGTVVAGGMGSSSPFPDDPQLHIHAKQTQPQPQTTSSHIPATRTGGGGVSAGVPQHHHNQSQHPSVPTHVTTHTQQQVSQQQKYYTNPRQPAAVVSAHVGTVLPQHRTHSQQQQRQATQKQKPQQHPRTSSVASATGVPNSISLQPDASAAAAPPPLFERLVTEEAAELKTYARVIEAQNRKLDDLERTNQELERRLERESRNRFGLEEKLDRQNAEWSERYIALEGERDSWKKVVSTERLKNEKLLEQVNRKNMEIQRFIQRRYDSSPHQHHAQTQAPTHHQRQTSASGGSNRSSPSSPRGQHRSQARGVIGGRASLRSPHELLTASGSGETVRGRNVTNTLLDFFGM